MTNQSAKYWTSFLCHGLCYNLFWIGIVGALETGVACAHAPALDQEDLPPSYKHAMEQEPPSYAVVTLPNYKSGVGLPPPYEENPAPRSSYVWRNTYPEITALFQAFVRIVKKISAKVPAVWAFLFD